MLRMIRGMGARNTNSSLVVEAIPNMHKIRRRNRASPDTGSYWKVHMWCLRAQRRSLSHYQFVRQSRQQEYDVHKTCYMFGTSSNRWNSRWRAVDLANNWSIGGCTRHVNVWQCQCFLWELNESKVMDIRWIQGSENDAVAFTKNLDGPVFEKCSRTLVGQDAHMKSYTSEQGGCWEGSQGTQKGIPMQTYFIFSSRSSLFKI
jgi:hypothetical protein